MFSMKLNADQAKQGSGLSSSRIDEKGKYKGKITLAKAYTTQSKAQFVEINFQDDGKRIAKISICTHGKNGEPTYGFKQVQAIMACVKVKEINTEKRTVEEYDFDSKQKVKVEVDAIPELCGKNIGLALYRIDETANNGKNYFKMEIAAPFNYDTEQTAKELLESLPCGGLTKIVLKMKDKDNRSAPVEFQSPAYQSEQSRPDELLLDDDIPF